MKDKDKYVCKCLDCGNEYNPFSIADVSCHKCGGSPTSKKEDWKRKTSEFFEPKQEPMDIFRKVTNPTKEELENDCYKRHEQKDGSIFYVTEYGCWTYKDGKVNKFEDEQEPIVIKGDIASGNYEPTTCTDGKYHPDNGLSDFFKQQEPIEELKKHKTEHPQYIDEFIVLPPSLEEIMDKINEIIKVINNLCQKN